MENPGYLDYTCSTAYYIRHKNAFTFAHKEEQRIFKDLLPAKSFGGYFRSFGRCGITSCGIFSGLFSFLLPANLNSIQVKTSCLFYPNILTFRTVCESHQLSLNLCRNLINILVYFQSLLSRLEVWQFVVSANLTSKGTTSDRTWASFEAPMSHHVRMTFQ